MQRSTNKGLDETLQLADLGKIVAAVEIQHLSQEINNNNHTKLKKLKEEVEQKKSEIQGKMNGGTDFRFDDEFFDVPDAYTDYDDDALNSLLLDKTEEVHDSPTVVNLKPEELPQSQIEESQLPFIEDPKVEVQPLDEFELEREKWKRELEEQKAQLELMKKKKAEDALKKQEEAARKRQEEEAERKKKFEEEKRKKFEEEKRKFEEEKRKFQEELERLKAEEEQIPIDGSKLESEVIEPKTQKPEKVEVVEPKIEAAAPKIQEPEKVEVVEPKIQEPERVEVGEPKIQQPPAELQIKVSKTEEEQKQSTDSQKKETPKNKRKSSDKEVKKKKKEEKEKKKKKEEKKKKKKKKKEKKEEETEEEAKKKKREKLLKEEQKLIEKLEPIEDETKVEVQQKFLKVEAEEKISGKYKKSLDEMPEKKKKRRLKQFRELTAIAEEYENMPKNDNGLAYDGFLVDDHDSQPDSNPLDKELENIERPKIQNRNLYDLQIKDKEELKAKEDLEKLIADPIEVLKVDWERIDEVWRQKLKGVMEKKKIEVKEPPEQLIESLKCFIILKCYEVANGKTTQDIRNILHSSSMNIDEMTKSINNLMDTISLYDDWCTETLADQLKAKEGYYPAEILGLASIGAYFYADRVKITEPKWKCAVTARQLNTNADVWRVHIVGIDPKQKGHISGTYYVDALDAEDIYINAPKSVFLLKNYKHYIVENLKNWCGQKGFGFQLSTVKISYMQQIRKIRALLNDDDFFPYLFTHFALVFSTVWHLFNEPPAGN